MTLGLLARPAGAVAPVAPALLALLAGCALGVLAWGEGRAPVAAIALPVLLAQCRSRAQAFLLAAGYAGGLLRYAATFISGWFGGNVAVGAAAVAAYMAITGAAWCTGWSRSPQPGVRAAAMLLAWIIALVPAGIGAPGHPLLAVGFLFPGTGWLGVVWSAVVCALVGAMAPWARGRARPSLAGSAALVASLTALGVALGGQPALQDPRAGLEPVTTAWGRLSSEDESLARMQQMRPVVTQGREAVQVWPESVIGTWRPSFYRVFELEVLSAARRAGRTLVVGMDMPVAGERYFNAAVAFFPDGSSQTAVARQPAPLSLWKPWASRDTFIASWRASNMLDLGETRAALIFCYEEYVPVLYLLNELLDRPTAYVALANTWAARQRGAAAIQTWHSYAMASLFGRPYIKAENQPAQVPAGARKAGNGGPAAAGPSPVAPAP